MSLTYPILNDILADKVDTLFYAGPQSIMHRA